MTAPLVKGYCPGALRPMMSGDGLVVRVRPFQGRLSPAHATGIARLADTFGNGVIELTSRGNVQIRGVTEAGHPALLSGLMDLGLLDQSPRAEERRNLIVTPFYADNDDSVTLSRALTDMLAQDDAPDVSPKFGFCIDAGQKPVLQGASADIRIERDATGQLILVADGAATGKPVTAHNAVPQAIELARWFLENRQTEKRMAALLATGCPLPEGHIVPRQGPTEAQTPGHSAAGLLVAVEFGQILATTLTAFAAIGPLRMTPWRMVLIEGAQAIPDLEGLITDPADPLLNVVACPGAPRCAQGHIETRMLARQLAPSAPVGGVLHVSGCSKGCAHPRSATVTVTGAQGGLNLIHNGRASDPPKRFGLTPDALKKAL